MSERVFVLGAGRAGRSLARALLTSGVDVVGLHGRVAETGPPAITAGLFPSELQTASVVLVTVRDAQLENALRSLAAAALAPGAVVLHASGATDPPALGALRGNGHPCGTLHPLVPLADPSRAEALLRGAWIGIEGDTPALEVAADLARRIGARPLRIPSGEKPRYHAAAVFAANFPIVLWALAERLLREAGVDGAEGRQAVQRLMAAAVENLSTGAPREVLTGPIARGDVSSVRRHLDVLQRDGEALAAYVALSAAALPLARAGGTSEQALGQIEALLGGQER